MTIDLGSITAAQAAVIASVATIFAALIAGTVAILVAMVNARAARTAGRDAARRQFELDAFQPYLAQVDQDLEAPTEVQGFWPEKTVAELEAIVSKHRRRQLFREPFTHVFMFGRDAKLREAMTNYDRALSIWENAIDNYWGNIDHHPKDAKVGNVAKHLSFDAFTKAASDLQDAAFEVRIAITDFIFR